MPTNFCWHCLSELSENVFGYFCLTTMALSPNELPDKIDVIQSFRGFATLSVLITHLWSIQDSIIINARLKKATNLGWYGVQIFCIISGFILVYSLYKHDYKLKNYFKFIVRRLVRLEPAYLVSILLALFFEFKVYPFFEMTFSSIHHSTRDILLHFFYLVSIVRDAHWVQDVYWTLAVEFQFYIVIGLIAPTLFSPQVKKYFKHIILIILLVLSTLFGQLDVFSFFVIGMSTFFWVNKTFTNIEMVIQIVLASITNYMVFKNPYSLIFFFTVPTIVNALLYKKIKLFAFFGKISYSLYLVHGVIGIFIIQFFEKKLPISSIQMQILALSLAIIASVVCAYIFYHLFENPFTKLARKINI